MDSERFYNLVVKLFDDPEEVEEVNELLIWWNWYIYIVFGMLWFVADIYNLFQSDLPKSDGKVPCLQEQCTGKDQGEEGRKAKCKLVDSSSIHMYTEMNLNTLDHLANKYKLWGSITV